LHRRRPLQATVRLGVDARDEEARHRGDLRWVAALGHEPLEPADVGLGDRRVAAQREDQRDVDRATLGDHVLDRRQAGQRPRDLHHQVRAVDLLVQPDRFAVGLLGLIGEAGIDLQRDIAVTGARALEHGREHVTRGLDVLYRQRPEALDGVLAGCRELPELLVVGVARAHRLLQDGRVRGRSDDGEVVDQALQVPAEGSFAGQVVDPDALAEL
jgi:hypothetical protein